jgi:hypothetical protein
MGLRPVQGRLLGAIDDGPQAAGAAVLTHRFWTTSLSSDPTVIGRTVTLGDRSATIVGVLEPSIPYPAETEIIANVATSPHHLSATRVDGRVHRMRSSSAVSPGASAHGARCAASTALSESIRGASAASASTVGCGSNRVAGGPSFCTPCCSALVFVIACSNVANLILARSVRREGELAVRAALGESSGALRRTLLAESLLLCGTGAILGVGIARPMVAVLSQYAARFSVRALEVTVDASLLWVGVSLALAAAVLLAFVPRLPSAETSTGPGLSNGSLRITSGTNRRLRLFAVTQIAASFVLLAGAGMLLATLFALQAAQTGFNMGNVLAVNVPCFVFAAGEQMPPSIKKPCGASGSCRVSNAWLWARSCRGATPGRSARASSSRWRDTRRPTGRRIRARGSARCRRASSARSACRSSPAAISPRRTAATRSRLSS